MMLNSDFSMFLETDMQEKMRVRGNYKWKKFEFREGHNYSVKKFPLIQKCE